MNETKIRLEKEIGDICVWINDRRVCKFLINGEFYFWGQTVGYPRYEGRWRNEDENGEFCFDLVDEIDEIRVNINGENQAFFNIDGFFEFYGPTPDRLYRGSWIE